MLPVGCLSIARCARLLRSPSLTSYSGEDVTIGSLYLECGVLLAQMKAFMVFLQSENDFLNCQVDPIEVCYSVILSSSSFDFILQRLVFAVCLTFQRRQMSAIFLQRSLVRMPLVCHIQEKSDP